MPKPRDQQLLHLVRQLRALYRDLYNARPGCDAGPALGKPLTGSQTELLSVVTRHRAGITATDLAGVLHISSGAITQLVDPLVEKGLLTRRENPQDRRSILIARKRSATQQSSSFEEFYALHISPMFQDLTDGDLEQLITLVQKIKNMRT